MKIETKTRMEEKMKILLKIKVKKVNDTDNGDLFINFDNYSQRTAYSSSQHS
jgi:hypothetical protein